MDKYHWPSVECGQDWAFGEAPCEECISYQLSPSFAALLHCASCAVSADNIARVTNLLVALISTRLDYCNSILTAQQNLGAWSIYDHAKLMLEQLCWLAVRRRSNLRLRVLAYRCLKGIAPAYFDLRRSACIRHIGGSFVLFRHAHFSFPQHAKLQMTGRFLLLQLAPLTHCPKTQCQRRQWLPLDDLLNIFFLSHILSIFKTVFCVIQFLLHDPALNFS